MTSFWWSYGQNNHWFLDYPTTVPSACQKCYISTKKGWYRCEVMFIMFFFRRARQSCPVTNKINYFRRSYGQNHHRLLDNPHTVPPACQKCCISTKKYRYGCEVMFFMFFFRRARLWCPVTIKMNYFWWSYGQNHDRFLDNDPHILFPP
jgi:hypothetical protein